MGIGIVLGIAIALGVGRLVSSPPFGVTANDISTLIGSVAVLCLLAMIACVAPGWRAAKLDPVATLRTE